jgi:hypothetical protein
VLAWIAKILDTDIADHEKPVVKPFQDKLWHH